MVSSVLLWGRCDVRSRESLGQLQLHGSTLPTHTSPLSSAVQAQRQGCCSRMCKEGAGGFTPITVPSSDEYGSDPEIWDVIVVGAGVAGSALAFAQGQAGRKVLVVERDLCQPDRIVGELLQPGGYLALKQLGLERCVEEIDAQMVYGYAMFKAGDVVSLKYPVEEHCHDVAGRSFHNGRFVQRLRQAASSQENVTLRQGIVKKLINAGGSEWDEAANEAVMGVSYKTPDGTERIAKASLTVVCDGMYSNLRKKFMSPKINHPSQLCRPPDEKHHPTTPKLWPCGAGLPVAIPLLPDLLHRGAMSCGRPRREASFSVHRRTS